MKTIYQLFRFVQSFAAVVVALALITSLGFTALLLIADLSFAKSNRLESPSGSASNAVAQDTHVPIAPQWRYTKQGWKNANHWGKYETISFSRPFENIHPTLWATDIVLASIGVLIWATEDERQIARLFGRDGQA